MPDSFAISVVVPTFNRGAQLEKAVGSALAQLGVEVEVIVCDDGSDDDSHERMVAIGDSRLRWLPGGPSGGPAEPRNRGIRAARHPFVGFLDSDDTWSPDKCRIQLDALLSSDAVASATNAWRRDHQPSSAPELLHPQLPYRIDLLSELAENRVVTSSMVVRTEVLRHVGGFPTQSARSFYEDYALWLRLASIGWILGVDRPLVNYWDDATTSFRGLQAVPLRCTLATYQDFIRWRRHFDPSTHTSRAEVTAMLRRSVALVPTPVAVGRRLARGPSAHRRVAG